LCGCRHGASVSAEWLLRILTLQYRDSYIAAKQIEADQQKESGESSFGESTVKKEAVN
jgi:hypothetical protein